MFDTEKPQAAFDLADAASICVTPFLVREQEAETVRRASDRVEAQRSRGVAWSGMAIARPGQARSADEIRAAAEAALARARAFAHLPRGRFLLGLRALDRQGYGAQAETARAAFARGFADPDRAACVAEIGCALAALGRIEAPAAQASCQALARLLNERLGLTAE